MKFWDTIAKMCGVKAEIDWGQPRYSVGRGGQPDSYMVRDLVKVEAGGRLLRIERRREDASISINGHGVRFRDSPAFSKECRRPGFRIGLIDIERIRPMVAKSADLEGACRGAQSRIEQAAFDRLNLS